MNEIGLTVGRSRLPSGVVALVDDADHEALSQTAWRLFMTKGRQLYAITDHGVLMHRLLTNAVKGTLVDHVNQDGLDNRRANLRHLTPSQAQLTNRSRTVRRTPAIRFKGVSLIEGRTRPWRATISVEGKQEFLGYHLTDEEAAKAYDQAARRFFGPFAQTNFTIEGGA